MELLKDYQSFVDEVTSDQSKNLPDMIEALEILEEQGVEPSRLLTAATGLAGECGEFNEIIKKCLFQGKAMMKKELFICVKSLVIFYGILPKLVWP